MRKSTVSRVATRFTLTKRWYAEVNAVGGQARLRITLGEWEQDGVHERDEHSWAECRGFDLQNDAMCYMMWMWPMIQHFDDIAYLRSLAQIDSSNLNTPSPRLRQRIGDYVRARSSGVHSKFTALSESDEVNATRLAITAEMNRAGACPTHNLEFVPG